MREFNKSFYFNTLENLNFLGRCKLQQVAEFGGFYALAKRRSLTLVTLIATGGKTVHPTPWPSAKRTRATGASIVTLQQRLRSALALVAVHRRTAFLRATDRAVIAQKQVAVAAINSTFLARARGIGGDCRSAEHGQQHSEKRHPAKAIEHAHGTTPC